MPYIAQTRDLTKQYLSYGRILSDYRPVGLTFYRPGMVCQLVPFEQQVYPDESTVAPTVTTAGQQFCVMGVVAETWPGFAGVNTATPQPNIPSTFLSPPNSPQGRGTQGVTLVTQGYHPAVLVDLTGGVAVTDGTILVPSSNTAGYAQGAGSPPTAGMGMVGVAQLPSTLTLAPGAVTQASAAIVVAGTTASAGNTFTITVTLPGGNQSFSATITLGAGTGPNGIANQLVTALNANTGFTQYFTAVAATGTITITVASPPGPPFLFNTASGGQFPISLSGSVGNLVATTASTTATAVTITAPAFMSGGVGYVGTVPAFITGAVC